MEATKAIRWANGGAEGDCILEEERTLPGEASCLSRHGRSSRVQKEWTGGNIMNDSSESKKKHCFFQKSKSFVVLELKIWKASQTKDECEAIPDWLGKTSDATLHFTDF